MLKAILWENDLYFLNSYASVHIHSTHVRLKKSNVTHVDLIFTFPLELKKRIEAEPAFNSSIGFLCVQIMTKFLSTPNMAVLDLVGSLLQTKIMNAPDNGIPANANG